MYQPCCLVQFCQGKLGERTKTAYKTYYTVHFVVLVVKMRANTFQEMNTIPEEGKGSGEEDEGGPDAAVQGRAKKFLLCLVKEVLPGLMASPSATLG